MEEHARAMMATGFCSTRFLDRPIGTRNTHDIHIQTEVSAWVQQAARAGLSPCWLCDIAGALAVVSGSHQNTRFK